MGKSAGKNIGKYNFILCMAREFRRMGHKVIELSLDDIYAIVPMYEFTDCLHNKKPINLKEVEYKYNPDFIYIEQMYNSFNINDIDCPVIYQHREYTHFPDVLNPDMLLASYYYRLRPFEFYHPWDYHNIPYVDYNLVAVDTNLCKPVEEKTIEGVTLIGLAIPMWQFRTANGIFGDMVMEDQETFSDKCIADGYITYIPTGLVNDDYINMTGKCEAILYDAGRFGGLTRRLFEAMAMKTLCVVRVHSKLQEYIYKENGLTDEMCIFIKTPEDVGKVKFTEEERKTMVEKAYEWVTKNHTYEVRARQLLEKVKEFEDGIRKKPRFMGFKMTKKISLDTGQPVLDVNICE